MGVGGGGVGSSPRACPPGYFSHTAKFSTLPPGLRMVSLQGFHFYAYFSLNFYFLPSAFFSLCILAFVLLVLWNDLVRADWFSRLEQYETDTVLKIISQVHFFG